jgi:hypothetical protein
MGNKSLVQKADKYVVRFPDGMRQEIKRLAAENGRTINAEIIYRLKKGGIASNDQPKTA